MANTNVFCNTPWYEAHIYWDGSLGICCQEDMKLYPPSKASQYNIKTMSLNDWFNSKPVRQFRLDVLDNSGTPVCNRCYNETEFGGTSRRHRANHKSAIFTEIAFYDSFEQSPHYDNFKFSEGMDGLTNTLPVDLHIDLGNYCNLACKMCWSGASSTIATQMVKWGHAEHRQFLGTDWTKDSEVWTRFLNDLLSIPHLKNIHLMGGETLLTNRFEELVDFMTLHKRFDVSFSFVTNGTVFKPDLIKKLSKFPRTGIEISIETVTKHNDYIRQGSKLQDVLTNIQRYKELCNDSISITLRPAISALSIGYYHTLLEYCLDHQFLIKSLIVTNPDYLSVSALPQGVKQAYKLRYAELMTKLADVSTAPFNESDPHNYQKSIKLQVIQALNLLETTPTFRPGTNSLVEHCLKWDKVYGFDAVELYPELTEEFTRGKNLPS